MRATRIGALALAIAALLLADAVDRIGAAPGEPRLGRVRAATPLRQLGRNLEWIRFQRASLAGEGARAIEHAERAVRLDPAATESWELLATHLAQFRGSAERELDLERRRLWFEAGLAVAERGERSAREPERLLLWRALALLERLRSDPELYGKGSDELPRRTRAILREARARGVPQAHVLSEYFEEHWGAPPEPSSR